MRARPIGRDFEARLEVVVVIVRIGGKATSAWRARSAAARDGRSGLPIAHAEGYCGAFTAKAVKGGPLPFSFGSNM
jgi:hypothetical protein